MMYKLYRSINGEDKPIFLTCGRKNQIIDYMVNQCKPDTNPIQCRSYYTHKFRIIKPDYNTNGIQELDTSNEYLIYIIE